MSDVSAAEPKPQFSKTLLAIGLAHCHTKYICYVITPLHLAGNQ